METLPSAADEVSYFCANQMAAYYFWKFLNVLYFGVIKDINFILK